MSLRRTGFTRNGIGQTLRRTALKRSTTGKPKAIDPDVMIEVYCRDHGECIVCHQPVHYPMPATFHHAAAKSRHPGLLNEPANVVLVCVACHDRHERAYRRIRVSELPLETVALFEREGLQDVLQRYYAAG